MNAINLYKINDKKTLGMSTSNRRVEISASIEETHLAFKEIHDGNSISEKSKEFLKAYSIVSDAKDEIRTNKCIKLSVVGTSELSEKFKDIVKNYPEPTLNGRSVSILLYVLENDNEEISKDILSRYKFDYVLPVAVRRYDLQAGPLILGQTEECTLEDLRKRRLAIAVSPIHELAMRESPITIGDDHTVNKNHIKTLIEKILETGPEIFKMKSRIYSVSLENSIFSMRDIHALPDSKNFRPRRDINSLIDKDHGIIQQVRAVKHHPSIPKRLWTIQADASDMTRISPWHTNTNCQGSSFDDLESATFAAIGESAERYCGNVLNSLPRIFNNWDSLNTHGINALDPRRIVMYGRNQYDNPKFPIKEFTRDKNISWVPGKSLTTGKDVWVPSSLVYVNYVFGEFKDEPVINMPSFPGIAAGINEDMAIISGIQEIVERHATMVWWHNGICLPKLKLTEDLESVWSDETSKGQIYSAFSLPNEFGIPVIAGVVEYPEEELFNIGFASRSSYKSATLKAWSEALTLQEGSRDLLNPNGLFRQAFATGRLNGAAMKPYRKDRLYMDSYRPDFRDVSDLQCQQQFYLDPRARKKISHIVDTNDFTDFPESSSDIENSIETYRRIIEEKGYEIIVVNITTPDIRSAGIEVVRVIIPGLVPNFSAAFPALGLDRLREDPVKLGIFKSKLDITQMNWYPLPHA